MWLFIAILLAQAPVEWVEFEICQLDFSTRPPVASRQRDHHTFVVRRQYVHAIMTISPEPEGIDCVQIAAKTGQRTYVIGTRESVQRKLVGK